MLCYYTIKGRVLHKHRETFFLFLLEIHLIWDILYRLTQPCSAGWQQHWSRGDRRVQKQSSALTMSEWEVSCESLRHSPRLMTFFCLRSGMWTGSTLEFKHKILNFGKVNIFENRQKLIYISMQNGFFYGQSIILLVGGQVGVWGCQVYHMIPGQDFSYWLLTITR